MTYRHHNRTAAGRGTMSLVAFLHRLFREGTVVLRERPRLEPAGRNEALALLEGAHAAYRLDVAGPAIDFDGGTALAAAELVAGACWFLVNHTEPPAELERCLVLPGKATTAAQHLSADLLLRLLPQVHRRARSLAADDRLTALLADVLRRWPLSGVLSDVTEPPLTPPEFDHPGLRLLYAERLARTEKPAWLPDGPGREYVELVLAGLGKERSPLLTTAAAEVGKRGKADE
jgi:hypothetical protein